MKFDMGRAWSDAMALLGANRQIVLVLAGVFFFLPYLALLLLMPEFAEAAMASPAPRTPGDPSAAMDAAMQDMMRVYADIWWAIVLISVLQAIGMLTILALLTDRDRPTVGEALAVGAKYFLPYFAAQILVSLVILAIILVPIVAGAAGGIAPGVLLGILAAVAVVYAMVKFSLTMPVVVMERTANPVRALRRSWALTKGNSLRLFLFFLLLLIVAMVIAMVVGFVSAVVGVLFGADGARLVGALINAAFNMVAVAVMLAALAAIHRQLAGTGAPVATFE